LDTVTFSSHGSLLQNTTDGSLLDARFDSVDGGLPLQAGVFLIGDIEIMRTT
jgi:hypothetical protein